MTSVAFIGLGAMGSRMAANLHAAGFALTVWNRDKAKTKPLAERGARIAASPADAAKNAEFVVSIVADDAATRAIMLGPDGVVGAAAQGTIILDCSTNTAAMAREAAAAAAARGLIYLDSPVSGSLAQAQGKELVFMVGGDAGAFDRAQPLFRAMGRMSRRMGSSGAGATIKLVNNMISAAAQVAIAEGAQVCEAAGLDPAAAVEVLMEGAAGCRVLKMKLPKMFNREFSPQFQLELMDKDVRYFLQLASELDRPVPLASLVRSHYQAGKRGGLGKLDSSAVFLRSAAEEAKK
ncbi:MAG: NAD(P)-dependent oxidoreductase [Betaproteobacteria bacterium]|nr:NAD(P)-dependent oxidoreductase [Betaproteobacteria bacterium]